MRLKSERVNLLLKAREMLNEQLDDLRVVVRAAAAQQEGDGLLARQAATKRAVFAHRVEAIDDRNDARGDGNRFALQAVWIAESVPLLVMMPDDGHDRIREIDAAQNLC